jgi:hypothetical protein
VIEMSSDSNGIEDCPRIRFLESLRKTWKTPNYEDFFFFMDGGLGEDGYVAAVITLDVLHNHCLGLGYSLRNTIHIRSIGVANHMRGVGFLSAICSVLVAVAEETGVFIYGTAKPFRYDVPEIRTAEEGLAFLERRNSEWESLKTDKKGKAEAVLLLKKYVSYGFQLYDSAGLPFHDRFWKKNSFGFASSVLDTEGIGDYFDRHLCRR